MGYVVRKVVIKKQTIVGVGDRLKQRKSVERTIAIETGKDADNQQQISSQLDVDAMNDFNAAYPNVTSAKIGSTNYSFYYLPPALKTDQKDVSKDEIESFQYAQILRSDNPNLAFDFAKDSGQYGSLAQGLISFVQEYMVTVQGLQEVQVPEARWVEMNGKEPAATCPIYMSQEFYWPDEAQRALNAKKTALVLIQGTGQVRAGIWARSCSINDGLKLGSMLPQVDWANEKDYPVIVMNPNQNMTNGKRIPLLTSMQTHCNHIWRNYVEPSGFKKLLVIAHSAGGGCVTSLMREFKDSFVDKVKQLAYTDSWVMKPQIPSNTIFDEFLAKKAIHYRASGLPLGTKLEKKDCQVVSAGHLKHEFTTGTAWPLIKMQFDLIKD